MDPNNMAGMPGTQNTNFNGAPNAVPGAAPQRSDAAIEMQAAIVADQIANPAGKQPQENPMAAVAPVKPQGGKGSLIAVVLFAVIAAAGVGFGVWMMMDGSNKETEYNKTIDGLKKQNSDLLDQVAELNEQINALKAAANNSNNNGGGSITPTPVEPTPIVKVTADVVDGVFMVKDENGDLLAQDDARSVNEIVSCETDSATGSLKCVVATSEGRGEYNYDAQNKTLNFILYQDNEQQ